MGARWGGVGDPLSRGGRAVPAPWPLQGAGRAARTPPAVPRLRSAPLCSAAPPRARRCRTGWDVSAAMAGAARDTPEGEQEVGGCEGQGGCRGAWGAPRTQPRARAGSRHSGVSLPSRAGLGQPGFVRGFVRVPSEYLEQLSSLSRSAASPVLSLECASRDLLTVRSGASENRLVSHLLSPAGLPPGQREVGCGRHEGFAPLEPQALPISRAVLWGERGCLTLLSSAAVEWEANEGERGLLGSLGSSR